FLIGIIYGLSSRYNLAPEFHLLLAVGFCGGFTTFSSFSYENIMLLQHAQLLYTFLYSGLSLIIGGFAAWLGLYLFRLF
ncbi:MAG TPA: CrcB family protein, partial [Balneolaceae bacterium]|nr:CrcB family protein [Balneolaceae bacterium]